MVNINCLENGTPLYHLWSASTAAGRAHEGLRADWQRQLTMAKKDCGFRYIRFHGLLHDDMQIYREIDGKPLYNFRYVDELFDFLLSIDVRPIVELGFMPEDLASTDATVFWWKSHISPPNDWEKWSTLISKLVSHWQYRYGVDETRKWYYEVWNEPDLYGFWDGSKSEYFHLYEVTAKAVKSVDSALRVGGPATSNFVPDARFDGEHEDESAQLTFKTEDLNTLEWHAVWVEDFLKFCEKQNLPVDFVSTHPYPTDFALDQTGKTSGRSRYKDAILDDLRWIRKTVAESAYPNAEIHLTEWSSSPNSRDTMHDYLPEATYIMRSFIANTADIQSLAYWTFTDVFEEIGAGPDVFHGGFGLINLHGVKKPAYHAYRMLNQLGDRELYRTKESLISKKEDRISAVFCNYPESYRDTIPMSLYPDASKAEACLNYEEDRAFEFCFENLRPGDEYCLTWLRKEDSPVEKWKEFGKRSDLTKEEERVLIAQSDVTCEKHFTVPADGRLQVSFTLPSWAIALFE